MMHMDTLGHQPGSCWVLTHHFGTGAGGWESLFAALCPQTGNGKQWRTDVIPSETAGHKSRLGSPWSMCGSNETQRLCVSKGQLVQGRGGEGPFLPRAE